MSKKARDRRARARREERYLTDREKPEDLSIDHLGWNRARIRSVRKWERQEGQLLFQDATVYEQWIFFGIWKPLLKGGKPRRRSK